MVTGGMRCVKYVLFIFNLIFFLAGLGLILIGALVQTKFNTYFAFFGHSMNAAAVLLIFVGFIVFVIGFFGCCGACRESYCMVFTFASLLCLVLVLEIAAAITAYVLRHQINSLVEVELKDATIFYGDPERAGVTQAWDKAQHEFMCCGANNRTDWLRNPGLSMNGSVPDSCCLNATASPHCGLHMADSKNATEVYAEGCVQKMISWAGRNISVIGAGAAGLALVEIVGIIIACCLATSIRHEYEVV